MPTEEQVRQAAHEVVAGMIGKKVRDADSLISSGLIDSLSILKLIGRLETRLAVAIPPDDLQPDDFETINTITDTVLRVAR
jgi:acyl carrier protein